jgi:hypothetical protein
MNALPSKRSPMRPRSLVLPLLAVLALAVLVAPAEGRTAVAHDAQAKGKRVVVSPRAGQVVHWHHVRLRVRSRSLADTLRVRVNGKHVGADFGRPRRGVRTLRASLSHGLRRGRNVLKVTVRRSDHKPRRATVRFSVRTKRHLVGAGRNRPVAINGTVRLRGQLRPATRRAARTKLRWKLIHAPRRSGVRAASAQAATQPAGLTSAAGLTAGFRPTVPGRYTLSLTAGSGSQTASDTVTVSATPRNLLVPIETMTATNNANGDQRGIRVGDTTYLLRDAGGGSGGFLQVLVLQRQTLAFVSNTKYESVDAADNDLGGLDQSKLVILVLQPGYQCCFYAGLEKVAGRIGVPDYAYLPKLPGRVSAIGVPRMARGDADVNVVGEHSGRLAPMKGYLTPDQYGNFGFVASERKPFSFAPKPSDQCTPAGNGGQPCDDRVGFRVRYLDSRTGAPAAHDGEVYSTNGRNLDDEQKVAEAGRMAADVEAMDEEAVVMIETVSNRRPGETQYRPPIGRISRAAMTRLANAVSKVGGTRNGFNRIALKSGSEASGGLTYALVGWQGAKEGAGAEVAAGVDGAGEAPELTGMLQRDRQSMFRPAAADTGPNALSELVLDEPTKAWPVSKECRPAGMADDDPGVTRAIAGLGRANELGPDPRATYALQPNTQTEWNKIAGTVKNTQYAQIPASLRDPVTEAQFLAARCQLVKELGWVGNVRGYLEKLKKPITEAGGISYSDVVAIGDRIFAETKEPDSKEALFWVEFVEILLELAGPVTHEASSTIAGLMQLGVLAFESGEGGGPADEVEYEARKLGDALVKEMQDTAKNLDAIGDVIVTDSAKLSFVGAHGGCVPAKDPKDRTCPEGYSFTSDDKRRVYADVYRGLERLAYEELLPFAFHTFGLNAQRLDRAPEARWYRCGAYHPWSYYSPLAVSNATTAELQELDPTDGKNSLWKVLVLSRPVGGWTNYGKPPSDALLNRMFVPVVDGDDNPREGGLGVSPSRLMRAAKWYLWAEVPAWPGQDKCS